uniref:GTP cyclohydrolase I n=1 Tax=viral metagenome TaxID=1070528 RepID=A0A6M3IW22_9ZZZZ
MDLKQVSAMQHIQSALCDLGITISAFPEIKGTAKRIMRMWVEEFFKNIDTEFDDFYLSDNQKSYSQIIDFTGIDFVSCCSHHLLPFSGTAHILYIPDKFLVGASKPARLVDHYSKRPQLQETLSHDIADTFWKAVKPLGVMVVLKATHGCISCRGVHKANVKMGTSVVRGAFASEPELELKGYELIKLSYNLK